MLSKVGLDRWNAPEVILRTLYNEKVDLWGVGSIFYFIMTGEIPFLDNNIVKLHQKILNGWVNFDHPLLLAASVECRDLIKKLLEPNPGIRYSAEEALNHNYFKVRTVVVEESTTPTKRLNPLSNKNAINKDTD